MIILPVNSSTQAATSIVSATVGSVDSKDQKIWELSVQIPPPSPPFQPSAPRPPLHPAAPAGTSTTTAAAPKTSPQKKWRSLPSSPASSKQNSPVIRPGQLMAMNTSSQAMKMLITKQQN